jgi:hypothetical protein
LPILAQIAPCARIAPGATLTTLPFPSLDAPLKKPLSNKISSLDDEDDNKNDETTTKRKDEQHRHGDGRNHRPSNRARAPLSPPQRRLTPPALPALLSRLRRLSALHLRDNCLRGLPGPRVCASLQGLTHLDLAGNRLRADEGLTTTTTTATAPLLPRLRSLDLSANPDLGPKPPPLLGYAVPRLERLSLAGCALRSLPRAPRALALALGGGARLSRLDLSDNRLESLPRALWRACPRLACLDASNNRLTCVPVTLGRLRPAAGGEQEGGAVGAAAAAQPIGGGGGCLRELVLRGNPLEPAQAQRYREGHTRFLDWLASEDAREKAARRERARPVGRLVGGGVAAAAASRPVEFSCRGWGAGPERDPASSDSEDEDVDEGVAVLNKRPAAPAAAADAPTGCHSRQGHTLAAVPATASSGPALVVLGGSPGRDPEAPVRGSLPLDARRLPFDSMLWREAGAGGGAAAAPAASSSNDADDADGDGPDGAGPPQPPPSARRGHVAAYDATGHRIVVFGGRRVYDDDDDDEAVGEEEQGEPGRAARRPCPPRRRRGRLLGDLAVLDLATRTWRRPVCEGEGPGPRAGAAACCHAGVLYVFGAFNRHSGVATLPPVCRRQPRPRTRAPLPPASQSPPSPSSHPKTTQQQAAKPLLAAPQTCMRSSCPRGVGRRSPLSRALRPRRRRLHARARRSWLRTAGGCWCCTAGRARLFWTTCA